MSHKPLRLSLAELHFLIGIAGIATAVAMLIAPDMTPHAVRVAVPRAIALSSVALLLIGSSALVAAWTTLRDDFSAKPSFAASGGLLVWLMAERLLAGLEIQLDLILVVAPLLAIVLTVALFVAERNSELHLSRRYSEMAPSLPA
jgi:hypothetical protein